MLKTETIRTVTLKYDPVEGETGKLIHSAIEDSLQLAEKMWGTPPPKDCHVYLMDSWFKFFFQAAPWEWKLLLGLTIPFWAPRAKRTWPYTAGWTQRFGKRVVIGVKTLSELDRSDKSVGVHMFIEEKDTGVKIRHLTCHELVHACSAHLKLPAWLNEGIAVQTVERYLGKQTIHQDTLNLIRDVQPKGAPPNYRELSYKRGQELAYHAVRGYWLVRYLEEKQPGFLRKVFSTPTELARLDQKMGEVLGLAQETFWQEIDEVLAAYFI